MLHRTWRQLSASILLVGSQLIAGAAMPASATEINLDFDTSADDLPAYDPNGAQLKSIALAAAEIWKALLPENGHNYSVTVHYQEFGAGDTRLGFHNSFDNTVTIRSDAMWFIDPTPLENEEFGAFNQVLYRDLDADEQASFVGPVPQLLETGYFANAIGGGPADGAFDMLTVMLHEFGHFLAIGNNILAPNVSLQPQFIGNRVGVEAQRAGDGHITPSDALMDPFGAANTRTLPSALDVIVAANEQDHSFIRLQRVDWLGDAQLPVAKFWSWDVGWTGGLEPNVHTEVTIRNGDTVQVTNANAGVKSLRIVDNSGVDVLAGKLLVVGDLRMDSPFANDDSLVRLYPGASLEVGGEMFIGRRGLVLQDATAEVGSLFVGGFDEFLFQPRVSGYGDVTINGAFDNRGRLSADGGTLRFLGKPGSSFDYDGADEANQRAMLWVRTGNLELHRPQTDPYGGDISIAGGHHLGVVGHWELSPKTETTFHPGAGLADFRSLTGAGTIRVDGTVTVKDNAHARFQAAGIDLRKDLDLYVGAGAQLDVEGEILYQAGGKYDGPGTFRQNGDATVQGIVTIGVDTFDWDGNLGAPSNTTIQSASRLTIKAHGLAGAYAGQVDVGLNSRLDVNITSGLGTWILGEEGKVRLFKNSAFGGTWALVAGTIEAMEGISTIDTQTTLTAKSTVLLHDDVTLSISAPTAYGGGVVTTLSNLPDGSLLQQNAAAVVLGHHRITAGFFNWDPSDDTNSSTIVQKDGFLDIRAKQIGNGGKDGAIARQGFGDQIDLNSGRLSVVVGGEDHGGFFPEYWLLTAAGRMNLNHTDHSPPVIEGSRLVNFGAIAGNGMFLNSLENHGLMEIGHADAAGRIVVQNKFNQEAGGLLRIELGGDVPGGSFDQLFVDADASWAGLLSVSLLGDFMPSPGQSFRIIDGGPLASFSGVFDGVDLPLGPEYWHVIYGANFVDLRFHAVPEPSTWALAALGLLGAPLLRRYRRRA